MLRFMYKLVWLPIAILIAFIECVVEIFKEVLDEFPPPGLK